MAARPRRPNLFELSGGGVGVTYSSTSTDGRARLSYTDAAHQVHFAGDEITRRRGDLGTTVSVTLSTAVDGATVSFVVVLPDVHLGDRAAEPVRSIGIRTHHAASDGPGPTVGQRQKFDVVKLRGTAQSVRF